MFKVFLVDDERIIRDGISKIIEWEAMGLHLLGAAQDGESAYAQIKSLRPDIVFTDIKMPGMSGLELIRSLREENVNAKFVVLSGHNEFEFASTAMQYGVKNYLLKPCDEDDITSVLQVLIQELHQERQEANFYKHALEKSKEKFLQECVMKRVFFKEDWIQHRQLLHLGNDLVRLILFRFPSFVDYTTIFAISNVSKEILGERDMLSSTSLGNSFLLLVRDSNRSNIAAKAETIKETFNKYYKIQSRYIISDQGQLEQISELYDAILNCKEDGAKYSDIVNATIAYINDNIDNEALSLNWIAKEILFLNEDYLSKLFKKETGEAFSHYLLRKRIEKAKELMSNDPMSKVYEIAVQTGFGRYPQYFSKVFKTYTGYSPKKFKHTITGTSS